MVLLMGVGGGIADLLVGLTGDHNAVGSQGEVGALSVYFPEMRVGSEAFS